MMADAGLAACNRIRWNQFEAQNEADEVIYKQAQVILSSTNEVHLLQANTLYTLEIGFARARLWVSNMCVCVVVVDDEVYGKSLMHLY